MSKFKFPRNPGIDRENPFEDNAGQNPFGESPSASPAPTSDVPSASPNPYASQEGTGSSVQPYKPDDYETFLPHRGSLVLWLGAIGVGVEALAVIVALIAIFAAGDFLEGYAYGLPGQLIGLAAAVPGWLLGQSDLAAIEAGAMDEQGRNKTQLGLRLAIGATLFGSAQLIVFVGLLIRASLLG